MEYGDLKSAAESTSSGLLLRQSLDNFYPSCYRISLADSTRFSQVFFKTHILLLLLLGSSLYNCVKMCVITQSAQPNLPPQKSFGLSCEDARDNDD